MLVVYVFPNHRVGTICFSVVVQTYFVNRFPLISVDPSILQQKRNIGAKLVRAVTIKSFIEIGNVHFGVSKYIYIKEVLLFKKIRM